ncbi:hypothetical protein [Desulfitobacterium sp.]|uniref:hypothetical protein n=1 Tax=Desulfitobacterium sp. TaxID=49981 RepID=UPI002B81EF4E|nr:hypothetical protein [Desulfitobacterium sp.]HVJ50582.1 hypothetical protein [Desulfitobacterium sp.]
MLQKKALMVATILTISISLVGCASTKSKDQTPTPPQASASTDLPADHPTETPAQPGNNASQADVEKKINDYLVQNYPGDWKVAGTTLSKGNYTENGNYKIVDGLEGVFPQTMGVSIFVGEERISTSVKQGTDRVLQGYPTPSTVGEVMKSGTVTSTNTSGYLKVYVPFKAGDKTVAVLTVSVPQQ